MSYVLTLILRFLQLPQPVLGPLYTIMWGSACISDDEKTMVQDDGDSRACTVLAIRRIAHHLSERI